MMTRTSVAASGGRRSRLSPSTLLEGASQIGRRLVASAQVDGRSANWLVSPRDRRVPDGDGAGTAVAGPGIYQGTAGIALFLTELYAATGDSTLIPTIERALHFVDTQVGAYDRSAVSFHNGRVGAAYALGRYGRATGSDVYREQARSMLRPIYGAERSDPGLDVIAGAAGAIPILLQLAELLDEPAARDSAVALGDLLIATARRWPEGWAWSPHTTSPTQDLAGLAHGAAGFGHALLELYAATGEPAYRFASEQAFCYETHHFDATVGNWPDYRSLAWSQALRSSEDFAALRSALRAGGPPPDVRTTFMCAWCHGAAGIGLTRLRAHALLERPIYAAQAERAARTTAATLGAMRNYSLCHGIFGNAETLIATDLAFGTDRWTSLVDGAVEAGLTRCERAGRPWPSGAVGGTPDPSLMLGDAGIGYFLLRLHDPTVPSILLPVAPAGGPSLDVLAQSAAAEALHHDYVTLHLEGTFQRFDRLGVHEPMWGAQDDTELRSAAARAYALVVDRVANERDPQRRQLMADAFRVDRERFRLATGPSDFASEAVNNLLRNPIAPADWDRLLLARMPDTRIVESAYDWETWLAAGQAGAPSPGAPVFHLLFRQQNVITSRRCSDLVAAMILAIEASTSFNDLVAMIAADSGASAGQRAMLRRQLQRQVGALSAAGIISVTIADQTRPTESVTRGVQVGAT